MIAFDNESEKKQFIEKIILPLMKKFCTERPIKINYEVLSIATNQALFSLVQLSWLQAISEIGFDSFNTIDWESVVLHARVAELQTYLYQMAQDNRVANKFGNGLTTLQHLVSPKLAIKMLDSIAQINRAAKHKEKERDIEQARLRLHTYRLAEINLTVELLRNIRECCKNDPVMLVPEQLPKTIWLKHLAHYLAISSKKYSDYGEIDYDDAKLINNAVGIHKLLREKLGEMLNISLNEQSLMSPAHREIAEKEGIVCIAIVATKPERDIPDDWSIEVTKKLALRIIDQLLEFRPLLAIKKPEPIKSVISGSISSKPSAYCNYDTRDFYLANERLLEQEPEHELESKAIWNSLISKKDDVNYKIKSITPHKTKRRSKVITFNSGHSTDYHAARQHIQKVITWFKTQ